MLKKANNVCAGDQIRGLNGIGTVKFIRWFKDDVQFRGYFVVEYPNQSAEVITMYQTEDVFIFTEPDAADLPQDA